MTGCTVDVKVQTALGNTAASLVGGVVGFLMENSGITGCSVSGDMEVSGGSDNSIGGLAGAITAASIINSSVSSNVIKAVSANGQSGIGGLSGAFHDGGIIENCYVTSNVSAESITTSGDVRLSVGGLAGELSGSSDGSSSVVIQKSYSTGTVSAINNSTAGRTRAGGISSLASNRIEITDCYSTGNVSADGGDEVRSGGIVANPSSTENVIFVTIARCYATGSIRAAGSASNKTAGGIMGSVYTSSGSITGCATLSGTVTCEGSGTANRIAGWSNYPLTNNIAYDDMQVNGVTVSGSATDVNGADKTSTELSNQATYTTLGWDFSTVWKMSGDSPSRPILKWQ